MERIKLAVWCARVACATFVHHWKLVRTGEYVLMDGRYGAAPRAVIPIPRVPLGTIWDCLAPSRQNIEDGDGYVRTDIGYASNWSG